MKSPPPRALFSIGNDHQGSSVNGRRLVALPVLSFRVALAAMGATQNVGNFAGFHHYTGEPF